MSVKQIRKWLFSQCEKVHGYTMPNNAVGFARLSNDLKTVHNPEIIFEATGVYSRRLQAFLEDNGYRLYTAKSSRS